MGIAEVIPGISGGTLALILGVYERLIKAIHSFNISLMRLLMHRRFKDAWAYVDGNYILVLFIGMLVSIFTLSSLILFFMEVYPTAFKSFLSLGVSPNKSFILSSQVLSLTSDIWITKIHTIQQFNLCFLHKQTLFFCNMIIAL